MERPVIRRPSRLIAVVMSLGLLASCDSDGTSEDSSSNELANRFGVGIPQVSLDLGMAPFGDHLILSAAIANGWFDDVGITIGPSQFPVIENDQILPSLVTGGRDITSQWGPAYLLTIAEAPNLTFIGLEDFGGTDLMAAPNSGAVSVEELVGSGVPFEEAMKQVMGQLVGKRVATDDTGAARAFFDVIFELGGISQEDFDLVVADDPQMLQFARGGQLDFAKPLGQAQRVDYLQDGWYKIVGVDDLVEGLPLGDPRGVLGLGHTGYLTTTDYLNENRETILRFVSVMYRVIDAIQNDVAEGTDEAIGAILPVVQSAAGVDIGIDGLRLLYDKLSIMFSFEEQEDWWLNTDSPFYYQNVYGPQIEANIEGGILPADSSLTPEMGFGDAEAIYQELVDLRNRYDELLPQAEGLEGDAAALAELAADHYAARNYVDAYRFLEAAIEGQA